MKLKEGFILQHAMGGQLVVPTGALSRQFNGVIQNNATAAFLYEHMMTDTTEEKLVDLLCENYEVDRETAAKDVHNIVEQLQKAGLLDD